MREILFRGKTKKGRWVEGWFCGATCDSPHGDAYQSSQIIEKNTLLWLEVIPETVGQYTGLTDKNGVKIFEGDLVRFVLPDTGELSEEVQEVVWDDKYVGFCLLLRGAGYKETFDGVPHWYVVIGNIHDNPELMGGNENESNDN